MKYLTYIFIFLALTNCQMDEQSTHVLYQEVAGRNLPSEIPPFTRPLVYRAKVPQNWVRIDPSPQDSIFDTTKALCEFQIKDGAESIRITVHNFPTDTIEERIPPEAQIARWRRQFSFLDPTKASVESQSRGGFTGLQFEGTGIIKSESKTMLGWSMQLAVEHYRTLKSIGHNDSKGYIKQMSADYTIKAIGPVEMMKNNWDSIIGFARSFELINEIPTNS